MAIADVKANQSLKKDVLVRLEHARDITDTLVHVSGNAYTVEYPFEPYFVKESGVIRSFSWGQTPEGVSVLTVFLGGTPSDTNPVIVTTRLFLTNHTSKYLDKDDPTGAITSVVEWKPLLLGSPTINQSIQDIIEATLSISSSDFSAINTDGFFLDYLSVDDTFYNKEVKIWFGLDENYELVFTGKISASNVNDNKITFSMKDGLKQLQQTAYMSDKAEESILSIEEHPDIILENNEKVASPFYTWMPKYNIESTSTSATSSSRGVLDVNATPEATIVEAEADTGPSNLYTRRRLYLGRLPYVPSNSTMTISASSYTDNVISGNGGVSTARRVVTSDIDHLTMNTQLSYTDVGGSPRAQPVTNISYENNWFELTYNTASPNNAIDITKTITRSLSITIASYHSSLSEPRTIERVSSDLVDTSNPFKTIATSGGNYQIYVDVLVLNTLAMDDGPKFYYIHIPPNGVRKNHGDAIKDIAESVGVTVNSSSITAANTALTAYTNMEIPSRNEIYKNASHYISLLAASTFGFVFINTSGELVYKLIDSLSPTLKITETDIIGEIAIKYMPQDAISNYVYGDSYPVDRSNQGQIVDDIRSTYLNDSVVTKESILYIENNFSSVLSRKNPVVTKARIQYVFKVSTKFFDLNIGDEIELITDKVRDGSVDLLVIGYSKSIDSISITAMEIHI